MKFEFIKVTEKKSEKKTETIATWSHCPDAVGATNYAEGYMQAYIDCMETTIYSPCVKQIDGYIWWNKNHSIQWMVVDANGEIVNRDNFK